MAVSFDPISFAIMAGANALGSIQSGLLQKSAFKMQADSFNTQANLSQYAFATNNRYLNLELGNQISNIYDTGRQIKGTQIAAHAASGFSDTSPGDKRFFADTDRKTEKDAYIENMNAYLKSFEMNKQANLQTIYYRAQAKIARQQAKYAGGWGMFSNIITNLLGAAAGSMSPKEGGVTSANIGTTASLSFSNPKLNISGTSNILPNYSPIVPDFKL